MNAVELAMVYKAETGDCAVDEVEVEFTCWRSKGQWVIDISDEERLGLYGRTSFIQFTKPDPKYIAWLESKVCELLTNKT